MRRFLRLTLLTLLLVALTFTLLRTQFLTTLTQPIAVVSRPVQTWLANFTHPLGRKSAALWHLDSLLQERDTLAQQIRQSIVENVHLLELERENTELRRTLGFIEQTQLPVTLARVVNRTQEGGVPFLVINRGAADGLAIGAPAMVDGFIVGKIIKTQAHLSVIAPLVSSGMKTAATFAGQDNTLGIVEGELNINLKMSLIPKDIALTKDMLIITSGLEEGIPRGLVIGRVTQIESLPQNLFQVVYSTPEVDLQEVTLVAIVSAYVVK